MGWKIVAGKKITVEVVFHIIRKFRNEIIVKAVTPAGKKTLGDLSIGAQNLNFYLPDDLVLFQTEVKQILPSGDITIRIPKMIAQVDRRKNMRLFIEEGMKADLTFKKENPGQRVITKVFNKRCFDISAGGYSFIISKTEANYFKMGDRVVNAELVIDNQKIKVHGKIINLLEVEPNKQNKLHYKGYKVCLSFLQLSDVYKKALDNFVFKYVELDEVI
jgi:hypothetical protein